MSNFALSLRQSTSRHPERIALVDGDARLSYAALDARVDALARGLATAGARAGQTVAVVSHNRAEFIELYYAVMRIGGVFLPVNFRLSGPEVAYQLTRAKVGLLFVGDGSVEVAREAVSGLPYVQCVTLGDLAPPAGWIAWADLCCVDGAPVTDVPRTSHDVQRIMFTSGTTSHPKAALTTHGQVWNGALVRSTEFAFDARDVNLVTGPLYHAGALDHFATTHLCVGGTVVVTRSFDARAVLEAIATLGVTNTWLSPAMARLVVSVPGWDAYDVSSLRMLLLCGEKAPEHLLAAILDAWPATGVHDCYGLTESSFATCVPADKARSKLGSVGRATLGTQVRVVSDSGSPAGAGELGEVQLAGLCVFPGYFEDPEATAAAFDGSWLNTGDIGYLDDDGYLYIVDRAKDMIRSGGENIASPEVERVLYEVPGVLEVAVVGVPDERWGEVPVAFVVPAPGAAPSLDDLLRHARKNLGKYKVPRDVYYLEELPRTPSGKVMKRALRESVAGDDPGHR